MKHSRIRPYDVEISNYCDEWYQQYYSCRHCGASFMLGGGEPKYCPNCGNKIKTIKQGLVYISNFKEDL